MNPNREALLLQLALSKPAAKRAAWLDAECECECDAALRQRLDALLADYDETPEPQTDSLARTDEPTIKLDRAAGPRDETVGQTLGRYKLLERVGEGGCGVVYVAEQTQPVRRRVALKVIKLGMDTREVIARFEAERQALAMMDHPNIARVLDAGTTELGRPYFVMELVRGIPITDYCDQANLDTKARLDLFIKVCQAIQHAHQKGIIHRDIKPSNILVTLHDGVPVPKVIDFGIAKATEGRLTDNTVYTQLHQFIGTPAYMSPEQAEMSGLDIDTRSDIYSLGVLLYELLAGSTPFDARDLMAQGLDVMRRTIREKEPPRPSTRFATLKGEELTTAARRRSADTSKLMHQLKGDLDWIVMKCLEKDRQRRYDTATGLAADLKRYLNNEPVVARPPSAAYKFQKAFRRNKLIFTAGTAVAAALLLGIIASTWQSVRATRAQAGESAQRQKAETNEQLAVAAQSREATLRHQAEQAELAARQRAYASDMNVAKQALAGSNLGRALDLLDRQRPQAGQRDLRGWEWRYLWKQTRSDALFTLCQERAEIFSLASSLHGNWLAMGSFHEGGLAVWDGRTRQELVRLVPEESLIRAAFSPTEALLAFAGSAASDRGALRTTLRVWNAATRQMMVELPLDNRCLGLAWAQDGKTLVTSTLEGQITRWQMPAGTRLASYPTEQFGFSAQSGFAAAPDLSTAVYALPQGRIRAIDLRDGRELWTAVAAKEFITALTFSPDGKTVASAAGYTESDIRLWDAGTGQPTGRLEGHGSWVGALVFWPDGRKLASCSADQTIRTWDLAGQRCIDVLRGHQLEVWRLALWSDHKTLVSGGKDGTVCFWNTAVPHREPPSAALQAEQVISSSFASDGQSIVTLNQQGQVAQWAGAGFQNRSPLLEVGEEAYSACFSEDGRFLAVNWPNGSLQVWDLPQRVLLYRLSHPAGKVTVQKFRAGGKRLITWSESDNLLHEWQLATGVETQSWPAPASFSSIGLSPGGQAGIAIGREGEITLRNLDEESGRTLELDILEGDVGSYSPDGKWFAIASSLGFARVWETVTWQEVATLRGFLKGAHSVGFSADGKRLAVGSGDHEAVKLWDTESWQEVFTLEGEGTGYMGTWLSPDGSTLTWGNQSGVVHVWQAPSWEEIHAAEAKEKAEAKSP
ncbi:MAG: protein kinase [Verrucomicrobiota bacterium]